MSRAWPDNSRVFATETTAEEAFDSGLIRDSRFLRPGSALRRVIEEAPYLARCSDDKTAAKIRPREYAVRLPYMQINRSGMVSWLILDLDGADPFLWQDKSLPTPNLIVASRQGVSAHLFYAIEPVCTSDAARAHPIQYMKAIYEGLARAFKADQDYHSGPVAKTPGHPWWITTELTDHVYSLGELADYVELETLPPWGNKSPSLEEVSHSRHCMLFEQLRHFAYSIVNSERQSGSFANFKRRLDAYAHDKNVFQTRGFPYNLRESALKATVKSVSRWTWDKYTGRGDVNRGVMQLSQDLSLQQRQSLAAQRTHKVRQAGTETQIRRACIKLRSTGQRLTQVAIAGLAGLSRQTVSKYRQLVAELDLEVKPVTNASYQTATDKARPRWIRNVKHAVHQVTAGLLFEAKMVVEGGGVFEDSS